MFGLTTLIPAGAGLILGLIIGGAGGYATGHWAGVDDGRNEALAAVRVQNEKAGEAADAARRTLSECRAAGGVWDQSTGKCGG